MLGLSSSLLGLPGGDVQRRPGGRHVHGKHVHPQLQAALRREVWQVSRTPPSAQQGQLSSPSQPLFCQDPFHQFSSLDASSSYDVTNSQWQLLREIP